MTSLPLPLDHKPTLWLEVALQVQGLAYNFTLGNQPVTLIVQDPAHLVRVTMEALTRALASFGLNLWQAMTLNSSMHPNLDPSLINKFISQAFQSIPFFPDPIAEDPTATP